jgi:hypothetical protein
MTATILFYGPLASDLVSYLDRLKAEGRAIRSPLAQLRAIDRLTLTIPLLSGSIDQAFAKTWLAPLDTRGPNTRRGRYFLLRGFCLFLARSRPQTFVPGPFLCPRRPTGTISPHLHSPGSPPLARRRLAPEQPRKGSSVSNPIRHDAHSPLPVGHDRNAEAL